MAPQPKRKRASSPTSKTTATASPASKKPRTAAGKKPVQAQAEAPSNSNTNTGSELAEGWFEAIDILEEDRKRYKIAWAPNPATGEKYEPTWQPKSNASAALKAAWVAKKKAEGTYRGPGRARKSDGSRGRSRKSETASVTSATVSKSRARPGKVGKPARDSDEDPEDDTFETDSFSTTAGAQRPGRRGATRERAAKSPEAEHESRRRSSRFIESSPVRLELSRASSSRRASNSAYIDDSLEIGQDQEPIRRPNRFLVESSPSEPIVRRRIVKSSRVHLGTEPDDHQSQGGLSDLNVPESHFKGPSPKVVIAPKGGFRTEYSSPQFSFQTDDETQSERRQNQDTQESFVPSNYQPAETFLRPPQFSRDAVIEDSQERIASDSYVPSTLTRSGEESGPHDVADPIEDSTQAVESTQAAEGAQTTSEEIEESTQSWSRSQNVQNQIQVVDETEQHIEGAPLTNPEDESTQDSSTSENARRARGNDHQSADPADRVSSPVDARSHDVATQQSHSQRGEQQPSNSEASTTQDPSGSQNGSQVRHGEQQAQKTQQQQPLSAEEPTTGDLSGLRTGFQGEKTDQQVRNPEDVSTQDESPLYNGAEPARQVSQAEQHVPNPEDVSTTDDTQNTEFARQLFQAAQRVPNPAEVSTTDDSGSNHAASQERHDSSQPKSSGEHYQAAQIVPHFSFGDSTSVNHQSGDQDVNGSGDHAGDLSNPDIPRSSIEGEVHSSLAAADAERQKLVVSRQPENPAVSDLDRKSHHQSPPPSTSYAAPGSQGHLSLGDPNQTSSSIPPVNSQLPRTFGSNPPPRIQTPSALTETLQAKPSQTSSSSTPASSKRRKSFRESLDEISDRYRREAERRTSESLAGMEFSKTKSAEASTRSPSAIPSGLPESPMLSQRTLVPSRLSHVKRAEPDAKVTTDAMEIDSELQSNSRPGVLLEQPLVAEHEFLIDVSLCRLQSDEYRKAVLGQNELTDTKESEANAIENIEKTFKRVRNVLSHMELEEADIWSQSQFEDTQEKARWIEEEGGKYQFLGCLLDNIRDHDLHLVILTMPGPIADMLETVVKHRRLRLTRCDKLEQGTCWGYEPEGELDVHILPTSGLGSDIAIANADLVVSFDSFVDLSDPRFKDLRRADPDDPEYLAPVFTPVSSKGLEHIERCISPSLQGFARALLLKKLTIDLQSSVRFDRNIRPDLVVAMIESQLGFKTWNLPPLESIRSCVHLDETTLSQVTWGSSLPHGTLESTAGVKRTLEDIEDQSPSKKTRLTPPPMTVNPADITHISDSQAHTAPSVYTADEIAALEARLHFKDKQVADFESALEDCQARYEDLRDEHRALRRDTDALTAQNEVQAQKVTDQATTISTLKAETASLRTELASARAALAESTVPELAELEHMRAARDAALAAQKHADNRAQAAERNFDFVTAQYQSASSAAKESAQALAAIQERLPALERKAAGETARALESSISAATRDWKDEVEALRFRNENLEGMVRRQGEELGRLRGGRGVGTRAGSVPRSPRVNGGSRAGSPAPGELGGTSRGGRVDRLRNLHI